MGITPELPDGTPDSINVGAWERDPDPYNGNVWFGDDGRVSVLIARPFSEVWYSVVRDERVSNSRIEIARGSAEEGPTYDDVVEETVAWMETHDPREWEHPEVVEAVFDAPEGFVLDHYGLGTGQPYIRYSREDVPDQYRAMHLVVEGYSSTDNWTVTLAGMARTRRVGDGEVLWDPEKGTPLGSVLAQTQRFAAVLRTDPEVLTEADPGDLDGEALLADAPKPERPDQGQAELAHFGSDTGT